MESLMETLHKKIFSIPNYGLFKAEQPAYEEILRWINKQKTEAPKALPPAEQTALTPYESQKNSLIIFYP
jgi:hypothetical protein